MPRRIVLTVLTVLAVVAAALLPGSVAAAATGCVPTSGTTGYTVTVCITAPSDGAVLSGPTTVSATAAVTGGGGTLRVSGVTFCFDTVPCSGDPSKYLLNDFGPDASGSFTFTLDTTLFADRTATLYAFAEMNDGLVSQPASESVSIQNGQTAPAPIPTGFSSTAGTAPGPGGPSSQQWGTAPTGGPRPSRCPT